MSEAGALARALAAAVAVGAGASVKTVRVHSSRRPPRVRYRGSGAVSRKSLGTGTADGDVLPLGGAVGMGVQHLRRHLRPSERQLPWRQAARGVEEADGERGGDAGARRGLEVQADVDGIHDGGAGGEVADGPVVAAGREDGGPAGCAVCWVEGPVGDGVPGPGYHERPRSRHGSHGCAGGGARLVTLLHWERISLRCACARVWVDLVVSLRAYYRPAEQSTYV